MEHMKIFGPCALALLEVLLIQQTWVLTTGKMSLGTRTL